MQGAYGLSDGLGLQDGDVERMQPLVHGPKWSMQGNQFRTAWMLLLQVISPFAGFRNEGTDVHAQPGLPIEYAQDH